MERQILKLVLKVNVSLTSFLVWVLEQELQEHFTFAKCLTLKPTLSREHGSNENYSAQVKMQGFQLQLITELLTIQIPGFLSWKNISGYG